MVRDNVEVPLMMQKCTQAIEKYGMRLQGVYRISGTTSKVAKLRERLDKGPSMIVGHFDRTFLKTKGRYGFRQSGRRGVGVRYQQCDECPQDVAPRAAGSFADVQFTPRIHRSCQ